MVLFSTKNLIYKDYKWTLYANHDPKVYGKPDNTVFDPKEGNEVVYLINKLMILWDYRFTNTGNKIERLIHDSLPPQIKTQETVSDWIKSNLKF